MPLLVLHTQHKQLWMLKR